MTDDRPDDLRQVREDLRRLAVALMTVTEGLNLSTKGRGLSKAMEQEIAFALEIVREVAAK